MSKRSVVGGISVAEIASLGFGPCLLLRVGLVNKFLVGLQPHWNTEEPAPALLPGRVPPWRCCTRPDFTPCPGSKSNGQQDVGRAKSAQEEPGSGLSRFLCDKASFLCRFNPPWPSWREAEMLKWKESKVFEGTSNRAVNSKMCHQANRV